MKFVLPTVVFSGFFLLAFYGSWVLQRGESNFVAYAHQSVFEDFAMWAAVPGDIVTTLIINPTDIPERDPEPWTIRWCAAPISSVVWTAFLCAIFRFFRYVRQRTHHCD